MNQENQTLAEHMAENRRERERSRLANTVLYFAGKMRDCNTIKLYKLLYLLDFEHYRQTGDSVTGLNYVARVKGPVPNEFNSAVISKNKFADKYPEIKLHTEKIGGKVRRREFTPNQKLDLSDFTPRMLNIMKKLVDEYRDHNADEMIEVTHTKEQPWSMVYKDGAGKGNVIPYRRALRKKQPRIIDEVESMPRECVKDLDEIYAGLR